MTAPVSRIVAIVQARVGSRRLPGKVLRPLAGEPLLAHVIRRVARAGRVHAVVLATSAAPEDRVLADFAERCGVSAYCGQPVNDVLARFVQAGAAASADVIVRICGDQPFVDPVMIDTAVEQFLVNRPDYLGTTWERVVPVGLDVEVFTSAFLGDMDRRARAPLHREHVTLFALEQPRRYRMRPLVLEPPLEPIDAKFTVDTEGDLAFAESVIAHFGGRGDVTATELIAFCQHAPRSAAVG